MKIFFIKSIKRPAIFFLLIFFSFFLLDFIFLHHKDFTKGCYAGADSPGKDKGEYLTGFDQEYNLVTDKNSILRIALSEPEKQDDKKDNGETKIYNEKIEKLKKERDRLKLKLKKLKEELAKLKKQYNEIAGMLEKEKETRILLEQRLEGVSQRKKKLEREAADLEEKRKEIVAKYKKKEEEFKKKINEVSGEEKIALEREYEDLMELKYDGLYELREREKKHQEAIAQMELDLQAQLDEERFARMQAEEEVEKLKKEKEKIEKERTMIEEEKEKIIEEMKREVGQQRKLLELANEEEKKKLKEEFKKTQQEKEKALEELKAKLEKTYTEKKLEGELRANLELEMKKKFEKMLKEELAKSMMTASTSPMTKIEKPKVKKDEETKKVEPTVEEAKVRAIPYDVEFENIYDDSGLCSNWITVIYEDETDIWIGTKDKGISRFIKDEGNWICYSKLDGLSGDEITSIVKYDNIMYIGTDLGISKFDGTNWSVVSKYKNVAFNNTLLRVHENVLWIAARIGTTKNGIYKYDGKTWETLKVASGLVSNFIYSIAVDGDDVWIGSCCGLVLYNATTFAVTILDKRDGLAHDSVYAIGIDGHAVWFATKGGISMYDGYDFINYMKTEGITDNRVTSLLVTPEYVWFGSIAGLTKTIKEY
jgi:hypothetical protein